MLCISLDPEMDVEVEQGRHTYVGADSSFLVHDESFVHVFFPHKHSTQSTRV